MPQRLTLPPLGATEERRRWAEAIADLHYFCGLVSEHAPYLIPGEHVEGFRAAWDQSSSSFEKVVQALTNGTPEGETISEGALSHAKLDGSIGAQKRSILAQLRDAFWETSCRSRAARRRCASRPRPARATPTWAR
jgi:hypothetical protein